MRMTIIAVVLGTAVAVMQPSWGQSAMANAAQVAVSDTEPIHLEARIVKIEAGTRTLTLKGRNGGVVTVEVGPDVLGFDTLKVGDRVDVLYKNALLVKVDKASAEDKGMRARVDTEVAVPTSAGYEAARQTEVLATVQKIDLKKRLVTLRGAYRTQTLEIGADVDLKRLKVGDTVHAVFVAAAAIQVTPLISAQ